MRPEETLCCCWGSKLFIVCVYLWVKFVRLMFLFGKYCAWSMWLLGGGVHFFFPSLTTKNLSLSFLGCTENTTQPEGLPEPLPPAPVSLPHLTPLLSVSLPSSAVPSHTHTRVHTHLRVRVSSPRSPFRRPATIPKPAGFAKFAREPGCSGRAVMEGVVGTLPCLENSTIVNSRLHTFLKK